MFFSFASLGFRALLGCSSAVGACPGLKDIELMVFEQDAGQLELAGKGGEHTQHVLRRRDGPLGHQPS
jgi:hypothetical protein